MTIKERYHLVKAEEHLQAFCDEHKCDECLETACRCILLDLRQLMKERLDTKGTNGDKEATDEGSHN